LADRAARRSSAYPARLSKARDPDESIWEVRGGPQQFTYSKIMAWVAFDRAVKSHEVFGRGAHPRAERWRKLRAVIHDEVCRRAFDPQLNSFVQSFGSQELDASLLQIPILGFLPADDARVRGTVAATERDLLVDGFVRRYRDRVRPACRPGRECSWLAASGWSTSTSCRGGGMRRARCSIDW
jgi:GH15 family glucan-1,4-alpha-glucosidase